MQDLKNLLIYWNNKFPFDRVYRQKHGIAFGSEEHRRVNQIDVYNDALEDRLFTEFYEEQAERKRLQEAYAKDGILNKEASKALEESLEEVFDNIDVTKLNEDQDGGQ